MCAFAQSAAAAVRLQTARRRRWRETTTQHGATQRHAVRVHVCMCVCACMHACLSACLCMLAVCSLCGALNNDRQAREHRDWQRVCVTPSGGGGGGHASAKHDDGKVECCVSRAYGWVFCERVCVCGCVNWLSLGHRAPSSHSCTE